MGRPVVPEVHEADRGVGEQVGHVVAPVAGVEGHHRGTEPHQRQPGERHLGSVAQHHADPVAGCDAAGREGRGQPTGPLRHVGVGEPVPVTGQVEGPGRSLRVVRGGPVEEVDEGGAVSHG